MLELQRADAEEIAGRTDQSGAAPIRMGRRREDRFLQHIFPIAGKFLFGDDARRYRALPPAEAADDNPFPDRGCGGIADLERRHIHFGQCLHQPEAAFLIVAEHVRGH